MIKALMIDVDGVLISGRPHDGKPWETGLEADLGITSDDLRRHFFLPYWEDIVLGRMDIAEQLPKALDKIPCDLTADDVLTYWFENDARINARLLAELDEQRQRGMRVYLTTNQEHRRAKYLMETIGLETHVDGMHYSAALSCRKPDRLFFDKVADLTGLAPAELLLIDDTSANVEAALAAGWQSANWHADSSLAAILQAR
jgi:putative hydrolase of the HAD superfamily